MVELVAGSGMWTWLRVVVQRVGCGCGAVEASGRCVLQEKGDAGAQVKFGRQEQVPHGVGMLSIHGFSLVCINPGAACSSPFKL